MKNVSYFNERNYKNNVALRKVLRELPEFCYDFFTGIENRTSALTRLNYGYDLRIFFEFMFNETNAFNGKNINTLEPEDLNNVKAQHIERFLSYLSSYEDKDGEIKTSQTNKLNKKAKEKA